MEYRIFVQIPGVRLADEASWERLIGWLEGNHGDLGPVISWDDSTTARITVATNAEDAAAAAEVATGAVSRALHATDLGALYPHAIEVESVDAKESLAA
ncbi:MAG TPA: hypothetical protein VIC06_11125 [Solirubrobacteraceae bacterium]|jgi:hypothetical protein